jgi:hypothetical protein
MIQNKQILYYSSYKHTRSPDAFNSTQQEHSQQQSKKPKGRDRQDVTEVQTPQAGTLQQPMLISGHTHASPEPRPTGLCKHTQTRTVHEKVPPTQPNAKLAHSACNEGCPADPARTSCFVTPAHAGVSLPVALSARNSPQRRAQRGSRLARLVRTWLASVGHAERPLPQP